MANTNGVFHSPEKINGATQELPDGEKIPLAKKDVIRRLRELGQVASLFGETDLERYNRLLMYEEKFGDDIRKDEQESSNTFLPKDNELEQLKFMKE